MTTRLGPVRNFPPVTTLLAPDRAADVRARRTSRAAYVALGWVVLFFAFHVYWYLGGSFASPGNLPGWPRTLTGWVFSVFVDSGWPLGAFVCLAIARGWARGRLAQAAAGIVCLGCALLLLRGGAGILDDLTRATGLLRNGITGLSTKDTTGHPTLLWSDYAIDSYFLAGGIIFGLLAASHRASRRSLPAAKSGFALVGHPHTGQSAR